MPRRSAISLEAHPTRKGDGPVESPEDRRDRETLERARREFRAGRLEAIPLETAKRELGD